MNSANLIALLLKAKTQAFQTFSIAGNKANSIVEYAKHRLTFFQTFVVFNVVLFFGLGGIFYLLRIMTDKYSVVPFNFTNGFLILLFWSAVLFAYMVLLVCLKTHTSLRDAGTFFVIIGFFEIAGFGFVTHHVLSVAPRSHIIEDQAKIGEQLKSDRKSLPQKINDYITLVNETNKGRFIIFYYDIKEDEHLYWDEKKMREELRARTCAYFSDPSKYSSINYFVHIFMSNNAPKYSFSFNRTECLSSNKTEDSTAAAPKILRMKNGNTPPQQMGGGNEAK